MDITLDQLKPGQGACVTALACPEGLQARLTQLGLAEDTQVCCRYLSPDRSVAALQVRGAVLALRRQDLKGLRGRLL